MPDSVRREVARRLGGMSAIVEVATTCNLACSYCFASRPTASLMRPEVAVRIVEQVLAWNGPTLETKFIWHGGEPTLAGIEFYERVLAAQRHVSTERHFKFRNSMQTNGTLLTDAWIDFLRENEFGVGSSLDGLPELHDARRRTRRGEPTWELVVRNLLRARERGLTIGVICVIDRATVPHVEAIYARMKELGLHFTMSPVTPNHGSAVDVQPLSPSEYSEVLIRLFDVWFDDQSPTIRVNPPHSVLQSILYGGVPLSCNADSSCFEKFVSFLPDGGVYPCNRFAGEEGFRLGSIVDAPLGEILDRPPRRALLARTKDALEPCATCDSSDMCRGGCAHHAYAFHGHIMRPDYYCTAFFKAFGHFKRRLETALTKSEASVAANSQRGGLS